jgi:hypothetical protein
VYDRQISEDQVLTFGVSGMLYRNGLIMYDHQTESLWSHILGQGIAGEHIGTNLTFIPTLHTNWGTWKELHPDTLVVSPNLFRRDSYDSYYISDREGVIGRGPLGGGPSRDGDIRPKEYVIGVRLAGQARAYPFRALQQEPVINDEVGEIPIVVLFDQMTLSGTVFDRRLEDGTVLTFDSEIHDRLVKDNDTNSEWNILTGQAVSGPLAGTQLAQVPITYSFWFGWIDYHTDSTVYQPGN